jgi:hypothetical protein
MGDIVKKKTGKMLAGLVSLLESKIEELEKRIKQLEEKIKFNPPMCETTVDGEIYLRIGNRKFVYSDGIWTEIHE